MQAHLPERALRLLARNLERLEVGAEQQVLALEQLDVDAVLVDDPLADRLQRGVVVRQAKRVALVGDRGVAVQGGVLLDDLGLGHETCTSSGSFEANKSVSSTSP